MKGNNKHIDFEAIRRYRADEMTPEERNAFEKELQKDPFLSEAFEGMEQLPPEEIAQHIRELSPQVSSPKKNDKFRFTAAAASVLILVSIGILWFQIQKENSVPKVTQAEKIESPSEVQEKEPITVQPEPVRVVTKTDLKKLQPLQAKVETKKALETTELAEMSPKILPIEKKEPEVAANVQEETELELAEALTGKVQGIMVDSKDLQLTKSATNQAKPDGNIRIRGYAKLDSDKTIVTTKTLRGKIISAADKMPLPGVTLAEKGSSNGAITDIEGNFELPLIDSNSTIVVSFIGMESKEISPTDSTTAIIELEPDQLAVDEVVVVGYGVQKKESVIGSKTLPSKEAWVETENHLRVEQAAPLGGYKELREYLDKNALLPGDYPKNREVVRLKISLDTHGKIQSFENLNDAPEALFEKVKSLILKGPKWQPALSDKQPTKSFVKLRVVFQKRE